MACITGLLICTTQKILTHVKIYIYHYNYGYAFNKVEMLT